MSENNEINGQDINEQSQTPSDLHSQERKPKNKLKNAGKKVGKNISDAFKEGARGVWKAMPLKVKLIVAGIIGSFVLLACVYVAYADYFVTASEENISDYYSGDEASSKGGQLYNSTGSLLLSTNTDIKEISKKFLEDVEPVNNTLYEFMRKKYKNGDRDNSGVPLKTSWWGDDALNINSNKTLYEHLLNTERYNFNKIRWIKYNRSSNEGMLSTDEMKVDPDTELQYPDDSQGTSFNEFVNKVRPYLQSWIIPYGIFSGLLSEGTGEQSGENLDYGQFAYQVMINGYHEIAMNQYNLEVRTVNTSQKVYDVLEFTVERTLTREGEGEETRVRKTTKYKINGGKNYTIIGDECQKENIVTISDEKTKEIVYKLEYARMFDRIIENSYIVHEYDMNVDTPEHYIVRETYQDGTIYTQDEINNFANSKFYNPILHPINYANYLKFINEEIDSWTGTYTYRVKKGYTQNETKIWKDKVETLSESDRVLKTYDVEEYINKDNAEGEERIELSSDEKAYYEDLAVEENVESVRMTRVDLINAKKDIYKKYLKNDVNYSENIGYPRSWMIFSYDTLKNHVKSIEDSETGWKYLYGASLGLEITVNPPSSTNNVGGNYSLIRDYNATGVLKAMQEVYAEYDLRDYHGYTWESVPWYPANADYAWDKWKDTVTELAADYGVDPLWVLAKMSFESGGGKYSGYGTGAAAGPMQIQKSVHLNGTIEARNVRTGRTDKIVMTREALGNDRTNIQIGIMMYANHLSQCNGNPYLAAQKYNYGNIGFVNDYAQRVGKNKDEVIADLNDVGWVYESMKYHNSQCSRTGGLWGDGYYAYKFAMYLDYLKSK